MDNPKYPSIVEDWERTYAILESLSPGVWVSEHTNVFDMRASWRVARPATIRISIRPAIGSISRRAGSGLPRC